MQKTITLNSNEIAEIVSSHLRKKGKMQDKEWICEVTVPSVMVMTRQGEITMNFVITDY